ncbi:MAG: hypothetical protein J0H69_18595 [Burkholderiales bacterium]|jgi:hypothetical protein|nr:hypothetical protein [Burkholderiales bacterium]
MSARSAKSRFWFTWGWPIVMAVLSAVGLLSALLGNGVWDWVSWIGLGIPALACCWLGLRRKQTSR